LGRGWAGTTGLGELAGVRQGDAIRRRGRCNTSQDARCNMGHAAVGMHLERHATSSTHQNLCNPAKQERCHRQFSTQPTRWNRLHAAYKCNMQRSRTVKLATDGMQHAACFAGGAGQRASGGNVQGRRFGRTGTRKRAERRDRGGAGVPLVRMSSREFASATPSVGAAVAARAKHHAMCAVKDAACKMQDAARTTR
jgi:hypothetical protein